MPTEEEYVLNEERICKLYDEFLTVISDDHDRINTPLHMFEVLEALSYTAATMIRILSSCDQRLVHFFIRRFLEEVTEEQQEILQ